MSASSARSLPVVIYIAARYLRASGTVPVVLYHLRTGDGQLLIRAAGA
jgi:hypothetical protein